MDYTQSNKVAFNEFKTAVNHIGLRFSVDDLQVIYNRFDPTNQGFFTYDEFIRQNGDRRINFLNSYKPQRRQKKDGELPKGIAADVRDDLGFTLDTTGE